jgi:hypothetical protein
MAYERAASPALPRFRKNVRASAACDLLLDAETPGPADGAAPVSLHNGEQLHEGEHDADPQLHSVPQAQSGLHAQAVLATAERSLLSFFEEQPQAEVLSSEVMTFLQC